MLLVAVLCPFVPMACCRYYLLRLTLSDSIATILRLSIVSRIHPFVIGYMLYASSVLILQRIAGFFKDFVFRIIMNSAVTVCG
ncbi:hypothetical protein DFH08DRAFT_846682 [Mycena albidolilacea]|uniref:Uncharacterized protein n=1 Tax=Mycena albidolilacea TaxID=1033008 RepID=A0AAD7AIH4_9AGAR|nr:hypothetical protein DFH08DRAFT_846682 [Mycena albidolilacea]